jgi:hypothetical protein
MHPQLINPAMDLFDESMIDFMRYLFVADRPGFGPNQIRLASLPLSCAGYGIILWRDIKHFAYLASQSSTLTLQTTLFPSLSPSIDPLFDLRNTFISSLASPSSIPDIEELFSSDPAKFQNRMATFYYKSQLNYFMSSVSPQHQKILLSNSRDHGSNSWRHRLSSQWLLALPNDGLHKFMTPQIFRAAAHLRLLIPFSSSSCRCPNGCGAQCDEFGYHLMACNKLTFHRHEMVSDALYDILRLAGFNPTRNAKIQCLGPNNHGGVNSYRPADILITGDKLPFRCLDVTIVSSLCSSHLNKSLYVPVDSANDRKIQKHAENCTLAHYEFSPLSFDVCGLLSESSHTLIKRASRAAALRTGLSDSYQLNLFRRHISMAIQIGVAMQLSALVHC